MTDGPDGYRPTPAGGTRVRSDIVDVYIFRRATTSPPPPRGEGGREGPYSKQSPHHTIEFLQLLRSGPPMDATWQPIMGHIEPGETAVHAALRELNEEVGLDAVARQSVPGSVTECRATQTPAILGLWALEQVHPYFIAEIDCIVLSPRFAAEVRPEWNPRLNSEHSASRWTASDADFMWPGQKRAIDEIRREIIDEGSLARERLRITAVR